MTRVYFKYIKELESFKIIQERGETVAIKPWQKVGDPTVLAKKFNRQLLLQKFIDDEEKEVEYSMYSAINGNASVVLPITTDRRVVAVRQFRVGASEIVVELPGGCPDKKNESPEETAARELEEETGYKPGKLIRLLPEKLYFDAPSSVNCIYGFLALDCQLLKKQNLDSGEKIEVFTMTLKDWMNFARNQASDVRIAALTFKALPYLADL